MGNLIDIGEIRETGRRSLDPPEDESEIISESGGGDLAIGKVVELNKDKILSGYSRPRDAMLSAFERYVEDTGEDPIYEMLVAGIDQAKSGSPALWLGMVKKMFPDLQAQALVISDPSGESEAKNLLLEGILGKFGEIESESSEDSEIDDEIV